MTTPALRVEVEQAIAQFDDAFGHPSYDGLLGQTWWQTIRAELTRLAAENAELRERLVSEVKEAYDDGRISACNAGTPGCPRVAAITAERDGLREKHDELTGVLMRGGWVRCDIPACNCGSWHHRYGLPERWSEIKDILEHAGHGLTNGNGHLVSNALGELVAERDGLRSALQDACDSANAMRAEFKLHGQIQSASAHWAINVEPRAAELLRGSETGGT